MLAASATSCPCGGASGGDSTRRAGSAPRRARCWYAHVRTCTRLGIPEGPPMSSAQSWNTSAASSSAWSVRTSARIAGPSASIAAVAAAGVARRREAARVVDAHQAEPPRDARRRAPRPPRFPMSDDIVSGGATSRAAVTSARGGASSLLCTDDFVDEPERPPWMHRRRSARGVGERLGAGSSASSPSRRRRGRATARRITQRSGGRSRCTAQVRSMPRSSGAHDGARARRSPAGFERAYERPDSPT
jgi:hypothetical protein